jgi:acetoin utilization deacetylase AcuC-like enzyme/GNAT superfamily N-acetyltransferase
MFRIRRIYDDVLPVNRAAIGEVQRIYAEQFPRAPQDEMQHLGAKLHNPFKQGFRPVLYVAENRGRVIGFALVLHEPSLEFCFLDFIAAGKQVIGRGVGAALYEHVRDEALSLGAKGLFFECLPDEAAACPNEAIRKENAARLRFYETYGARPIIGTTYETPVPGGSTELLPHLVYDSLDGQRPPAAKFVREVMRAILERKYASICPPEYVAQVVGSVRDPVRLREFRYQKKPQHKPATRHPVQRIAMTINDRHEIHHIRERGYVEAPVRVKVIRTELEASGLVETLPVKEYPLKHIAAVHDAALIDYLRRACQNAPPGKSVYPYVFPIRNHARPPKELSVLAGYYCIDTFTPIHANAFLAARRAVDCTLTAADELLAGRRIAYALVRPPGHHAERKSFGGFCYFCNNAVAAHYFSQYGRVAIVDIDYHHGNGQQDIFYERADVLTVSIHGDPSFAYPYFTGFADERGSGPGEGFNLNLPLPEVQDGKQYRKALARAIEAIEKFDPDFLVIALGLDPAKGDPTGTWLLKADDFEQNGHMLGALGLPMLVVQEGGYRTRTLGVNAKSFFRGLVHGAHEE